MATVQNYLEKITPNQRAEFVRIKEIVKQVAPNVEESISYGMPAFKYKNRPLLYFGVFKDHMSIFPGAPVEIKDKLKGYKLGKGTVQFTEEKLLPEAIIKEILLSRIAKIDNK